MFAVLHVPQFPLQAVLRHESEAWTRPVVLVDPGLTTPRIVELNRHARAMGVEIGFTAPQALARCTEVVVRHRSIAAEESAEAALIQCAYGFSPNVEWTDAGWITLELRGLAELAGEPGSDILASWAGRLHQAAVALGMTCRIGVGPNPTVARHAATAPGTDGVEIRVVTASDAEPFVGSLPVTALEPSPHTARLLAKWGIRTVAEFKALGQAELADRLGLEAFALWAAAAARNTRPLRLVRPPEHYREGCEFDPPIETLEPLLFLLRRFVDSIEHRLEPAGKAVGGLILQLRQESGDLLERRLRVPQPTRRADVLFRMLQTHLEGVRTESSITAVQLEAEPARPSQHQFSLFEAALRDPHQFQETLARLSALVGPDRVGSPLRRDGHRPDVFCMVPPDFENAPSHVGCRTPEILRPAAVRRLRPALSATVTTAQTRNVPGRFSLGDASPVSGPIHTPKPGPVFQPREIAALLDPIFRPASLPGPASGSRDPDPSVVPFPGMDPGSTGAPRLTDAASAADPGRPFEVRCELAQGRVTVAVGPWRSSGNWWDRDAWNRTEWDVSVRGSVPLRLAWDGTAWQVEAVMD